MLNNNLNIITFGKYKGELWSNLLTTDLSYVLWALNNVKNVTFPEKLNSQAINLSLKQYEFRSDKIYKKKTNYIDHLDTDDMSEYGDGNNYGEHLDGGIPFF